MSRIALRLLSLLCLVAICTPRLLTAEESTEHKPVEGEVPAEQPPAENAENKPAENAEAKPEEKPAETATAAEGKPAEGSGLTQGSSTASTSNLLKGDSNLNEEEKKEARKWFYTRYGVVSLVLLLCFLSYMYGRDKTPLI